MFKVRIMSLAHYSKYLHKADSLDRDLPSRKRTAIVLSDSKGNYIKQHVTNRVEQDIIWCCNKSQTSEAGLHWLFANIDKKLERYGELSIYIWLGTCDLTIKGKYVALKSNYLDVSAKTIEKYQSLLDDTRFKGVKIVFLEIPYFSIKEYNRFLGHKDPDSFVEQDQQLETAISKFNSQIHKLNEVNGVKSPKFCVDLIRGRGRKRSGVKYYNNFNVYTDGIHPKPILAKYWLRKIAECVRRDCY